MTIVLQRVGDLLMVPVALVGLAVVLLRWAMIETAMEQEHEPDWREV